LSSLSSLRLIVSQAGKIGFSGAWEGPGLTLTETRTFNPYF